MSTDELIKWIIDVDRRLLAMTAFKEHRILKASEIADITGRSAQNMSRALHEMEEKGLVESVMPDKRSWKKYMLTERGQGVLKELEKRNLLQ